jgi:RNA polymerase sigma-70 factor, ECF subfamily
VARFAIGLIDKYGAELLGAARPVLVNGDLGVVLPGDDAEVAPRVFALAVRDGRTAEVFDIVNPDKLTRVEF